MATYDTMNEEQLLAAKRQQQQVIDSARKTIAEINIHLEKIGVEKQVMRVAKRIGADGIRAVQTLSPGQIESLEKVNTPGV